MNEFNDNRNYKYENQYYQKSVRRAIQKNYNNSNNYNLKEKYAVYDFDRQSQNFYLN